MPIRFDGTQSVFTLQAGSMCYLIKLLEDGRLCHLYYGADLGDVPSVDYLLRACGTGYSVDGEQSPSIMPMEYPSFGTGDLRESCLIARNHLGQYCADLRFQSYEILPGKPMPTGLPALFADGDDCETLVLLCEDSALGLEAKLFYSVLRGHNAVARRVEFRYTGELPVTLTRAFSGCLELPDDGYELLTFHGAWARERTLHRAALNPGRQGIFSHSGGSGHVHNPLMVLQRSGGGEDFGQCYAANLVYSGNFAATVEVSHMGTARVVMGVDSDTCSFPMTKGETLVLPELVLFYAEGGLGDLTRGIHDLYREHLVRKSPFAKRPVLINNWEATYFDFDQQKLEGIIKEAAHAGMDLFVLDDGWFGHRDDDGSSLGDWFVNTRKLPNGLQGLSASASSYGMKLGLWVEPESISEDSELYRAHPDWCIHIPGRERTRSRRQLLADITRPEVRDAIYTQIKSVLESAPVCYVKWDMNRPVTEPGGVGAGRQERFAFDYILALYEMMERLHKDFPEILLEGCSAGGARFDPGMLYYCPQIWASDNTDASARLDIQLGTAFAYPVCTIGSHVSMVPNHQTGREIPMETRFAVALCGTFGYELDPGRLSQKELEQLPEQIAFFNRYESLIAQGDYYRFYSPANQGDDCCFGFIAKDKRQGLVVFVQRCRQANVLPKVVRLTGFAPKTRYQERFTGGIYTGAALCHAGFPLGAFHNDFESRILVFDALES